MKKNERKQVPPPVDSPSAEDLRESFEQVSDDPDDGSDDWLVTPPASRQGR